MKIKCSRKLCAVFVIFLCFCCGIRLFPKIASMYNKNKDEYEKISLLYEETLERLESKESFMEREAGLIEEREKLSAAADIRQENIISVINRCMISCGIGFTKISFDEAVSVQTGDEGSQETESVNKNPEIVVMKAVVEFSSSYEKMLEFVDLLDEVPVELSVTCVNVVLSGGGTVSAGISINFYGVRDNEENALDKEAL